MFLPPSASSCAEESVFKKLPTNDVGCIVFFLSHFKTILAVLVNIKTLICIFALFSVHSDVQLLKDIRVLYSTVPLVGSF